MHSIYCLRHFSSIISKCTFSFFCSFAPADNVSASNSKILRYLIENCGFSETLALPIANRIGHIKNPQKPDSVIHFLRQSGFSEGQIRDAVRVTPQILLADVNKTLKPKFSLLQELGLTGSELGLYISKNSSFLTTSLERKLTPCIKILQKLLCNNSHVVLVLQRCKWIVSSDPSSKLLPNISSLQSCGIADSQLSMLLRRQPSIFIMKESALHDLIHRVKDMGFSTDSRMFVYALYTISCMKPETLHRKFKLLQNFGISEDESMSVFRRAPSLLRTSEEKLQLGLQVYTNVIGVDLQVLVQNPGLLMFSIERRVLPRHRVIGILQSKMLLKKDPAMVNLIVMAERVFLRKYILKFEHIAELLLVSYKGDVC